MIFFYRLGDTYNFSKSQLFTTRKHELNRLIFLEVFAKIYENNRKIIAKLKVSYTYVRHLSEWWVSCLQTPEVMLGDASPTTQDKMHVLESLY